MKYLAVFWIKDENEDWGYANTILTGPRSLELEHVRRWEQEVAEQGEMKIAILVGVTKL